MLTAVRSDSKSDLHPPQVFEKIREVTHFITMTFWENLDVIKGFAGDDAELAKYYPEDKDFLLEFEPGVVHYEVVGQS